jgi:hypothetical protein
MNEQINRIRSKIGQLKKLDKGFSLFGSQKHKYKINPTISMDRVRQFELAHRVSLQEMSGKQVTQLQDKKLWWKIGKIS